ncbi:hypothetical protein K7X08_027942 [Anisodus acutangulus]|uniref:C2H2-type domain-containing protein n=1 Tax=Anisodus acutangulus TaxID=402998 RepID=A0A9Q1RR63_9SOLA|nr:hypothetical protein K7X08_027942 [Anisodus acutangulus]
MLDNQEHSGSGTLWINLEIPKDEQVKDDQPIFRLKNEDDGQIQKKINDSNNSTSKICHVCKKRFSSGKALGGHMRIHVQHANKEFISGNKRKTLNREIDILKKKHKGIYNDEPAITCSVCSKNFPSMKSLFGHMRCHPDRDWRGTQPPPNNSATVDLSKAHIGGWSVTAKRGRSRNKPIIDYYSSEEEQQLHDAVHYLMLLAYGDSLKSSNDYKQGIVMEELDITNTNSLVTKKRTIEGTNNICQMKRSTKRMGRKMMKLKDLDSIQNASNNPVAVFPTPEKYNKLNIDNIQNSVEETEEEGTRCSNLLVASTSECKNINTTTSQVSSVIRNSISGARIMDFDLNELPLPEEDDDDEAAAVLELKTKIIASFSTKRVSAVEETSN